MRESFDSSSAQRTTTGQFTFGRNAQARLGQSYNPGSSGMQGILGVKKASLFNSKVPNTGYGRKGDDLSD